MHAQECHYQTRQHNQEALASIPRMVWCVLANLFNLPVAAGSPPSQGPCCPSMWGAQDSRSSLLSSL